MLNCITGHTRTVQCRPQGPGLVCQLLPRNVRGSLFWNHSLLITPPSHLSRNQIYCCLGQYSVICKEQIRMKALTPRVKPVHSLQWEPSVVNTLACPLVPTSAEEALYVSVLVLTCAFVHMQAPEFKPSWVC